MFQRPFELLSLQSQFSDREVGFNHPDVFSFIRLADNGDIYIMAQDGLGIIISAAQQAIILVGETIKFLTNEEEGLKWNSLYFNPKANKYSESTFVNSEVSKPKLYDGINDFLD